MKISQISKKIKQPENMEDTFSKIISDFKTPVQSQIGALVSFLSTANSKINAEEKELIELTLNSCKTLQNMTDILSIAYKINFEKINLEYEKFDFIELLKEILEDFKILLTYYDLKFELKTPEKLPICADKTKIKKILENLIFNNINTAFKASKIIIKIINKNTQFDFQIQTNSRYIEPSIADEIFKKDKKHNSPYSKPMVSLGLYTASEIIYAHFGSIYLKSYPNDVNIMGFTLPLSVQKAQQ